MFQHHFDDGENEADTPIPFNELLCQVYEDEEECDTDELLSALEADHSLTGKQRHDLLVRLYEIREAWRVSEEEGTICTEPEDMHDVAAMLFALSIGIEYFEGATSSADNIETFNVGINKIISSNQNAETIDAETALEMYVRGCSLLNSTEFFDTWYEQYHGTDNVTEDE